MNVYLKSAVQNLDAHIAEMTDIRNRLANGLGPEIGKEVFPPEADDAAALPGSGVQTFEPGTGKRVAAITAIAAASGKRFRKAMRKQNGGGRKVRTKTEVGGPKAEGGAVSPALTPGVFKPSTLSGSMKLEISRVKEFTLQELQTLVDEKYREEDFHKNAAGNSFYGNLTYWAKTGRLEKSGDGAKAVFKVLDKEFFSQVEFQS